MNIPKNLKYTREHEWLQIDGNQVIVGITDFAQKALGDVVFVDLPEVDVDAVKGEAFAAVESVKAVSDVYSPVAGTIYEVNEILADSPEILNQDPYEKGWMVKIELAEGASLEDLLDAADYAKLTEGEE